MEDNILREILRVNFSGAIPCDLYFDKALSEISKIMISKEKVKEIINNIKSFESYGTFSEDKHWVEIQQELLEMIDNECNGK